MDELLSTRTVLAVGRNRLATEIRLVHDTAGLKPAGSRARYDCETWGVVWTFDNASHGHLFASLNEARAFFESRNVA